VVTPQVNTAGGFAYTPTQRLAEGVHSVTAQVYDRAGNQTQSGPWSFTVSRGTAPSLGVTKYYMLGSQRIAMRQDDVVYFIHADHLGSTSLTTDITGTVVAETRYLPYGEERWITGTLVTDFTFTGQRAERGFALMDYNARYYDPGLGRFVSADTVVPEAGNPQALNRYAYANNNPLRYNDPSGHFPPSPEDYPLMEEAIKYFGKLGWEVVGDPRAKSLYANAADLVLTQGENVLAVELKDVGGNVTLGTLGKSAKFGDYGGSISRVSRSAERLLTSSNSQLSLESQTVKNAYDAGKLQNALFTSAEGVSEGAQEQFNAAYRRTGQGTVQVVKSLPRSGAWSTVKDQLNTRIFNYTIGARMLWEEAVSTVTTVGNTTVLPPVPLMLDPRLNEWYGQCYPDRCKSIQD
jgi:RHS repeat-associated protein